MLRSWNGRLRRLSGPGHRMARQRMARSKRRWPWRCKWCRPGKVAAARGASEGQGRSPCREAGGEGVRSWIPLLSVDMI